MGGVPYTLEESLIHWRSPLYTGGDPYTLEESLIRWRSPLYTGGVPYTLEETLIHWRSLYPMISFLFTIKGTIYKGSGCVLEGFPLCIIVTMECLGRGFTIIQLNPIGLSPSSVILLS